jgi:hypothetical protein
MRYNFDEYDIAGFFPVIVRVDYAYEGRQARSVFLYEIFYSGWLNNGGKNGKGLDLGKPRLVRSLESNEDPTAILRERFQQWAKENFTDHLVPEEATPTATASKNKAKPKKRK